MAFGVQILMSEGEVEGNHPKINRALQFEKEKRENEKILDYCEHPYPSSAF